LEVNVGAKAANFSAIPITCWKSFSRDEESGDVIGGIEDIG